MQFVQIEGVILSGGLTSEQVRRRGVDGGDEGISQKDAAQGVEGVDAVLSGRGDIVADTAEVHEGVKAARPLHNKPPVEFELALPFNNFLKFYCQYQNSTLHYIDVF